MYLIFLLCLPALLPLIHVLMLNPCCNSDDSTTEKTRPCFLLLLSAYPEQSQSSKAVFFLFNYRICLMCLAQVFMHKTILKCGSELLQSCYFQMFFFIVLDILFLPCDWLNQKFSHLKTKTLCLRFFWRKFKHHAL